MDNLYDTGIRPAITEYLNSESQKVRDYGNYWSASSAGYCMRLNILKRLKVPSVPEIADDLNRQTRVFESGKIFHEWAQRITKNAGLSIAQELELQDEELLVRGHIDDLVIVNDNLILYDFKTVNSQAFNYKKDEIGHYHKMQLGTYMYMLRNDETLKVWNGDESQLDTSVDVLQLTESRIMQISKDDLRMREQQLMWSADLSAQVVNYWKVLQQFWANKTMPPCMCADHDGGFMSRRSKLGKIYNPFYYHDEPCSLAWAQKHADLLEGWTL